MKYWTPKADQCYKMMHNNKNEEQTEQKLKIVLKKQAKLFRCFEVWFSENVMKN